jgi:hypothetical protein
MPFHHRIHAVASQYKRKNKKETLVRYVVQRRNAANAAA